MPPSKRQARYHCRLSTRRFGKLPGSHFVPLLQAGSRAIQGYRPAFTGPFQYAGGGMRTAWIEGLAQ